MTDDRMTEALVDVAEQIPREVDQAVMHISCLLIYYTTEGVRERRQGQQCMAGAQLTREMSAP